MYVRRQYPLLDAQRRKTDGQQSYSWQPSGTSSTSPGSRMTSRIYSAISLAGTRWRFDRSSALPAFLSGCRSSSRSPSKSNSRSEGTSPAAKSTLRFLANLVVALATSRAWLPKRTKRWNSRCRIAQSRSMASTSFTEKQGRKMRPPFSYCTAFRRPGGDCEPHSDEGR
jgi:hypothetical protein